MDPSLSYSDNHFQRMYTEGHFYDDFSKEDSKLLISVLNSTPTLQEQEMSYLPSEYYYYPMISQQNEMMRMNKKNYQDNNNYNVNVHLNYYPEEDLLCMLILCYLFQIHLFIELYIRLSKSSFDELRRKQFYECAPKCLFHF